MPNANLIHDRVAHFLAKWPPFHLLDSDQLNSVAKSISIRYIEEDETLFKEGEAPEDHFYLVHQGSIRITSGSHNRLIDICDEGDLFGIRALIAKDNYAATAQAAERSLLYVIPVEPGFRLLFENPESAKYFTEAFASGKVLTGTPFRAAGLISNFPTHAAGHNPSSPFHDSGHKSSSSSQAAGFKSNSPSNAAGLVTNYPSESLAETGIHSMTLDSEKEIVRCHPEEPIRNAAQKMRRSNVGSIIITDSAEHPVGIVTNRDLRDQIATGEISVDEPIHHIMTQPVITAVNHLPLIHYQTLMMKNRIHHICITEDGSDQSPVLGIVSEHDLLLEQNHHPAVIMREISESTDIDSLKVIVRRCKNIFQNFLKQNMPAAHLLQVSTAIYDHLFGQLIHKSMTNSGELPCKYAWISLGSLGRKEQLLLTDQDHALIIENPDQREFFLRIAEEVTSQLEEIGFPRDPANIIACNPDWCLGLNRWKETFKKWVKKPEPDALLHSTIFFDFRVISGDTEFGDELRNLLFEKLPKSSLFLSMMAKNALETPAPLSFFKNFLLEKDGQHKDHFDLKLRALLPLVDMARIMALQHGIAETSTINRYRQLAELDSNNKTLLNDASDAFEYLLSLRFRFGFMNSDTGRYIRPDHLSKIERVQLREIFHTISELQKIVGVRFQTDYIR